MSFASTPSTSTLGTTRFVFLIHEIAFKFARHPHGANCNISEAQMYHRVDERRRAMLCPVIACLPNGALLLMEAATPLSWEQCDELRRTDGFPDWDYNHRDRISCPFEYKPWDWGYLKSGRLVALDFPDVEVVAGII